MKKLISLFLLFFCTTIIFLGWAEDQLSAGVRRGWKKLGVTYPFVECGWNARSIKDFRSVVVTRK